jgi:phosphate starvation-inducible membrane PsiE
MDKLKTRVDRFGQFLVDGFQIAGLFVLGATIVWAAVHEYIGMIQEGRASLDDILLLFIYLELGAMVGVYFRTDRLPVLFLLYVAITAMTRFLVVDIDDLSVDNLLIVTGAVLMLTLSVLILQFAEAKYTAAQEPQATEHCPCHRNLRPV